MVAGVPAAETTVPAADPGAAAAAEEEDNREAPAADDPDDPPNRMSPATTGVAGAAANMASAGDGTPNKPAAVPSPLVLAGAAADAATGGGLDEALAPPAAPGGEPNRSAGEPRVTAVAAGSVALPPPPPPPPPPAGASVNIALAVGGAAGGAAAGGELLAAGAGANAGGDAAGELSPAGPAPVAAKAAAILSSMAPSVLPLLLLLTLTLLAPSPPSTGGLVATWLSFTMLTCRPTSATGAGTGFPCSAGGMPGDGVREERACPARPAAIGGFSSCAPPVLLAAAASSSSSSSSSSKKDKSLDSVAVGDFLKDAAPPLLLKPAGPPIDRGSGILSGVPAASTGESRSLGSLERVGIDTLLTALTSGTLRCPAADAEPLPPPPGMTPGGDCKAEGTRLKPENCSGADALSSTMVQDFSLAGGVGSFCGEVGSIRGGQKENKRPRRALSPKKTSLIFSFTTRWFHNLQHWSFVCHGEREAAMSIVRFPRMIMTAARTRGVNLLENQRAFVVDKKVTKHEIKEYLTKVYGLEVENVRTANYDGKLKRAGPGRSKVYRTKGFKKAIVTFSEDSV